MEWGTLAIAVVGAVTGVAALAWQVHLHFREVAEIQVDVEMREVTVNEVMHPLLHITVRNVGYAPAQVARIGLFSPSFSFGLASEITIDSFEGEAGLVCPSLPLTLDARHQELWEVPLYRLARHMDSGQEEDVLIGAAVRLGDRERLYDSEFIPRAAIAEASPLLTPSPPRSFSFDD